mmetsp:Transcript_30677/g.93898  ORF Transcript_30677/g.93898 Transcript_30677/m.93898 type:complete len:202 (-) Transcript_30677:139-744(-)|eukprot:scaffold109866_cov24-Tisochrysis_lutea.AAC.1
MDAAVVAVNAIATAVAAGRFRLKRREFFYEWDQRTHALHLAIASLPLELRAGGQASSFEVGSEEHVPSLTSIPGVVAGLSELAPFLRECLLHQLDLRSECLLLRLLGRLFAERLGFRLGRWLVERLLGVGFGRDVRLRRLRARLGSDTIGTKATSHLDGGRAPAGRERLCGLEGRRVKEEGAGVHRHAHQGEHAHPSHEHL